MYTTSARQAHDIFQDLEKKNNLFVNSEILAIQIWRNKSVKKTNFNSGQNNVNQIFHPHAFFFLFLTGATWYYHAIYIVFKYFASFTGYKENISIILILISNLHVQGSKFGAKFYKFYKKKK